jgi:CRP-like cAMP-binding protein
VLDRVLNEDPVPPIALRPDLPAELDALVRRMLQKYPEDRYPDWAELALHLARLGGLSRFDQAIRDSEKFLALRPTALLKTLDDAELWEIARIGRWRRVPSQSPLVREGEPGDSIYLLARGEAKVTVRGRLLNVLHAGDCFGEMGYVQETTSSRQATVETTADTLVAELPRESLDALSLSCQLKFNRALLRALADRLALANARLSAATSAREA